MCIIEKYNIFEREVSNDFVWNPYDEEHIEKYGSQRDEFVVPIRFSDGKTQDYKFIIVVYHSNPVDYSGISMGMKSKEVKKLQGKPNGKNRYSEKVWRYNGCVTITFNDGVVSKIKSFDVNDTPLDISFK